MSMIDVAIMDSRMLGVLEDGISEYERACAAYPIFPDDAIHAAATIMTKCGELVRAAANVYDNDTIANREELHREWKQTLATAIRFGLHMGDMKSKEQLQAEAERLRNLLDITKKELKYMTNITYQGAANG